MNFSALPPKNDWSIRNLQSFEERHVDKVADSFKSRGKYTDLSWYMQKININSLEEYTGQGLFGQSVYKKKYCYENFYEASKEFTIDLQEAFASNSHSIEEDAVCLINHILGEYEKALRNQLKNRLHELEVYVTRFQQHHGNNSN